MATRNRIDETAQAAARLAERWLNLLNDTDGFLGYNSAQSIDWGGATKPTNLEEDVTGHIQGMDFTRQAVSNGIGSFAAVQTLMSQGHLGNLQLLAKPRG